MKTYTVKTFYFDELTDAAKWEAYRRDQNRDFGTSYNSDFQNTLEKFEEAFGISVYRWEVYSTTYTFDFSIRDDLETQPEDITNPIRLAAYVYNNCYDKIKKGKYYSTGHRWENGKFTYKFRYSKINFSIDDCPLTGVFCDCDILSPIIDCLNYTRLYSSFDDLITDCLNRFFETWRDALEYSESFEFYAEEAQEQGWEYLADGTKWVGGTA